MFISPEMPASAVVSLSWVREAPISMKASISLLVCLIFPLFCCCSLLLRAESTSSSRIFFLKWGFSFPIRLTITLHFSTGLLAAKIYCFRCVYVCAHMYTLAHLCRVCNLYMLECACLEFRSWYQVPSALFLYLMFLRLNFSLKTYRISFLVSRPLSSCLFPSATECVSHW